MRFYFDESGNFQVRHSGEHNVGIVSGIAIPDSEEAEVFRRFDAFVNKLPSSAFKDGEPKGRLLDDDARKDFAHMLADIPGILLCPAILDLTSVVGQPQADVPALLSQQFIQVQSDAKHQSFRDEIVALANDAAALSPQQAIRLTAWAQCISRTIKDSIVWYSNQFASSWTAVRFELDPVEEVPGREDRVFRTMLPMMMSIWSHKEPLPIIEGLHAPDHPFMKTWNTERGVDIGGMVRLRALF